MLFETMVELQLVNKAKSYKSLDFRRILTSPSESFPSKLSWQKTNVSRSQMNMNTARSVFR